MTLRPLPLCSRRSYTRYGPGAFLARHTDEHHAELKRGGRAPASGAAVAPTRRSVSWLVYLNDAWSAADGGALRVHERAAPAGARVGARGRDLQIGWLKGGARAAEEPVFLDAERAGPNGNCVLYAVSSAATGGDAGGGGAPPRRGEERRRDITAPFFADPALFLAGGDFFARKLLVADADDAARFHLLDAPKNPKLAAVLPPAPAAGEDGGERAFDVLPTGGTLVLFDSVALPHEVRPTVARERYACSGWFHEDLRV